MKNSHGFSLVELVTIIVLLSILSITVLPNLLSFDFFKDQGFYGQVLSAIRFTA